MLQRTGTGAASSFLTRNGVVAPLAIVWLKPFWPEMFVLWPTLSLLRMSSVWPVVIPCTWVRKRQTFWSKRIESVFGPDPSWTRDTLRAKTTTLAIPLLLG